ncbi:MAG TPA: 6-phosphogluconolactonase [Gallionellaceae bacterium]|nr:6-phosphogluconolactonase [Gallionellaceae bacterium]
MIEPQVCRWHTFGSDPAFHEAARDFILGAAANAISERGAFIVVLAGGNTPRSVYRLLRDARTEWRAWHVYFGDERCLPPGDPARNSRMAQEEWLGQVAIPGAQIHPIPAERGAASAAEVYSAELAAVGTFDLVILGLGEDGHTASLFPGGDWEAATNLPAAIAVHNAPKPPAERVSLSPQRLSQSRAAAFLVQGEGKRMALDKWRTGATLPASAIRPPSGVDVFLRP